MKDILIILCILLLGSGCQQIIRLDNDDYQPKAVVWALLGADSIPEVYLTQTLPNTGWLEQDIVNKFIEGATPEFSDGTQSKLLDQESRIDYRSRIWFVRDSSRVTYYKGDQSLQIGKSYDLSFEFGGETIKAETTIPSPVAIDRVEQTEVTESDGFSTWSYPVIRVYLTDQIGSDHSYRVQYTYTGWTDVPIFDPVTGQYLGREEVQLAITEESDFVTDERKEGQELYIDIGPYFSLNPTSEVLPSGETIIYNDFVFRLQTFPRDAGDYFISLQDQAWNQGDPLAEPVLLKSNIENGLGIFAGYSTSDTVSFRYVQ